MSTQPSELIETITLEVRAPNDHGYTIAKASSNDSQDPWAYRMAVGAVGASIVVFLIGSAVIAAVGQSVPSQYWTSGSALSGALLGILAPSPTATKPKQASDLAPSPTATKPKPKPKPKPEKNLGVIWAGATRFAKDVWGNRAILILLAIFGVAVWRDIESHSTEWQALAAATGGALLGLLAPSPAKEG